MRPVRTVRSENGATPTCQQLDEDDGERLTVKTACSLCRKEKTGKGRKRLERVETVEGRKGRKGQEKGNDSPSPGINGASPEHDLLTNILSQSMVSDWSRPRLED